MCNFENFTVACLHGLVLCRLRVVSSFGDRDCGAGEIHTRARAKFRGDATRGERQKAPLTSRLLEISRARVCISPAPQSRSPKLETTRSLGLVAVVNLSLGWFYYVHQLSA